jgi:serine/threonine protein kinase
MAAQEPSTDDSEDEECHVDYLFQDFFQEGVEIIDYVPVHGVEPPEGYRSGGYHPVKIGNTLGKNYLVVHKLGFGGYSTIWLAVDKTSGEYVAIKVGTGYSSPLEGVSLTYLQKPSSFDISDIRSAIPPVLDEFDIQGPNGRHPCYVTTVGGANLEDAKLKDFYGIFRLDVARAMAAQLVIAVAHVHERGYVHGDVTLENVLLRLPLDSKELSVKALYEKFGEPVRVPVVRVDGEPLTSAVPSDCIKPVWLGKGSEEITLPEAKIMLIDYGETYLPERDARHTSGVASHYKPPECLWDKKTPMTFSSDIWTLACTLWDLVAWFPLFKSYFSAQDDITAEQVAVLGRLPPGWWATWSRKWDCRRRRFDREGKVVNKEQYPDMEARFEEAAQQARRKRGMEAMEDEEKEAFFTMLRSMLMYRPEERVTAQEVLKSDWMVRWAIPEYEKIREHQSQKKVRFAEQT